MIFVRDEYDWDIVGGENYPGTKTGWSLVKAAPIDQTDSFDLDILLSSEHHDDFSGSFGMEEDFTSLQSYSFSFVGLNIDDGEPEVAVSSSYDDPLEEIDDLREFVENEISHNKSSYERFRNDNREYLEGRNLRDLDIPAFDIAIEVNGDFYGVDSNEEISSGQTRVYEVRASNAVEKPVKIGEIPNKDYRETLENAVEEIER